MNSDTIMGLVRHILTFGGGFLVTQGYFDDATMQTVVGALATLIGVAWSIWDKQKKSA